MIETWRDRRVLVTGGASLIGSHLVDALVHRGAQVSVIDDLSSGSEENLEAHLTTGTIDFTMADLRAPGVARLALRDTDCVFHLAADHGGRGYVDTYQAGPASNLFLDGLVFWEALQAGVEKVVFASSGCVYPDHIQTDTMQELYLTEDLVGPPYAADNMYGWAKLMAEETLRAYHTEHGMQTASCRYFTVYGPRCKENHAVIAMIAKAHAGLDPFPVWGTGEQIRNWTHVDDIVRGTILAAERIDDGTAVNLGTMERVRVLDAAKMIMQRMGHDAEIETQTDMPTGPVNRVADNRLARERLGWEPAIPFEIGVERTIDWYRSHRTPDESRRIIEGGGLIARKTS